MKVTLKRSATERVIAEMEKQMGIKIDSTLVSFVVIEKLTGCAIVDASYKNFHCCSVVLNEELLTSIEEWLEA